MNLLDKPLLEFVIKFLSTLLLISSCFDFNGSWVSCPLFFHCLILFDFLLKRFNILLLRMSLTFRGFKLFTWRLSGFPQCWSVKLLQLLLTSALLEGSQHPFSVIHVSSAGWWLLKRHYHWPTRIGSHHHVAHARPIGGFGRQVQVSASGDRGCWHSVTWRESPILSTSGGRVDRGKDWISISGFRCSSRRWHITIGIIVSRPPRMNINVSLIWLSVIISNSWLSPCY